MIQIIAGLFFNPHDTWTRLAAQSDEQLKRQLWYPVVMAALPPAAFCYGTSMTGWKVFGGGVRRLTVESALPLATLFYLALLGAIIFIGWMIHTIASTYHTETSTSKGIMMMAYACTPVFITGILGAYPVWWLDLVVATSACSFAIYHVYIGIPEFMKVPEDRGFLFASAVFMVALVYVVAALVATVLMWEYIATPVFTG